MRANNLAGECKSNAMLLRAVKMLMVIPFLPAPTDTPLSYTMLEGFQAVEEFTEKQSLPTSFKNVLGYVDSFWFTKVKCKNFTLYKKKICIIKYIEMFHIGLLSFLKPDGNIWTLTSEYVSDYACLYIATQDVVTKIKLFIQVMNSINALQCVFVFVGKIIFFVVKWKPPL